MFFGTVRQKFSKHQGLHTSSVLSLNCGPYSGHSWLLYRKILEKAKEENDRDNPSENPEKFWETEKFRMIDSCIFPFFSPTQISKKIVISLLHKKRISLGRQLFVCIGNEIFVMLPLAFSIFLQSENPGMLFGFSGFGK